MKPLLPSLREKKRYIVYEIISDKPIKDVKSISKAFWRVFSGFLGELGCSEAGIILLEDKYNKKNQRGLIRVATKFVDKLKASLAVVEQIDNEDVIVKTIGSSGTLKKAEGKYIAA
ncbi:hypothetical protein HN587_03330 [Candidatus Woesearchaeota archaeon]|jgi:ribonuclease P/MRP protein subunit POP5|nr:hypothetical protein [Candidatus Woesearchaeota archaeon]